LCVCIRCKAFAVRALGLQSLRLGYEPVVVGLSAGGLLLEGAPSPADVAAFVDDYAQVSPTGLDEAQRRVAGAAARWVLAFNARCDLAMLSGEPDPTSALGRLLEHRAAYG